MQLAAATLLAGRAVAIAPTITYTSSNFRTFLTIMPYSTTFSAAAEVQVVLASIPLLALGFTGFAFGGFELSISRLNRAFLNLFVALAAAFAAGIFELFNVLQCELEGMATMSGPLLVAQGLALATFLAFLFFFLFRRTQHPMQSEQVALERLPTSRTSVANGTTETSRFSTQSRPPAVIHSGSYQRWGVAGGVIRVGVYLTILTVGLLEGIWRLGFIKAPSNFRGVYTASHILQIILAVFFFAKLVISASIARGPSPRQKFLEILPLLFGISLIFIIAVVGLVPNLLLFSDTPLGRFLTLVEVFTFLLHTVILDHKRPIRDSLSFDSPNRLTLSLSTAVRFGDEKATAQGVSTPPPASQTPSRPNRLVEEPLLPERIVVRRSSRLPSWLGSRRATARGSDTQSLTRERDDLVFEATSPTSEDDLPPSRPIDSLPPPLQAPPIVPTPALTRANTVATVATSGTSDESMENERIMFTRDYQQSRRPSPELRTAPSSRKPSIVRPNRHARVGSATPSVATYDARGIRLSSPNMDLQFSESIYGSILKQQLERDAMMKESQTRTLSVVPEPASAPPPSSPPFVFPNFPPTLPPSSSLPPSPIRPSIRPVQPAPTSAPAIDTAAANSSGSGSSNNLSDLGRRSEVSLVTSERSEFSLSNFPAPPEIPDPPASEEQLPTPRPFTTSSSRATNLVTEGGLEFELFPPRPLFAGGGGGEGRDSVDSDKTNPLSYDVTSLIVGNNIQSQINQQQPLNPISERSSRANSGEYSSGPQSPMPTSPAPSELAEIRQATVAAVVRSSEGPSPRLPPLISPSSIVVGPLPPTRGRKGSIVTVEETGRVIPPRQDQDASRRVSPTLLPPSGSSFGLPSNPRRKKLDKLLISNLSPSNAPASSSSESDASPATTTGIRRFSSSSEEAASNSPDTSVGYDPTKPFEKPRPAPLVLIREEPEPSSSSGAKGVDVGPSAGVALSGSYVRRTRSRGGRRKDIKVVREP